MTPLASFVFTLSIVYLLQLHVSHAASSAYPCHKNKNSMGKGVTCTEVAIPPGICKKCPLRPPNSKGQFVKCWDILDTEKSSCLSSMRQYVNANPCDPVRAKALDDLESNPEDKEARQIIDYFLYSICEQCCDCVPMGANDEFFSQYKAAHTPLNPSLYDPARGNCPAHAYYDVCKVLPKVTSFYKIGNNPKKGMPPACPLLFQWFDSPASKNWQNDPQSDISSSLRSFLLNMLQVHECESKPIWDKCYELEEKQKHLGVPEDDPSIDDTGSSPGSGNTGTQPPPNSGSDSSSDSDTTSNTDTTKPEEPSGSSGSSGDSDVSGGSGSSSDSGSSGSISEDGSPVADKTPSASEDPTPRECFPSDATVELQDGSVLRMDKLRIGDIVRVGINKWEPVYLFSHSDESASSEYVRVVMSTGHIVEMTGGHMLKVNGELMSASKLKRGDSVWTVKGKASVHHVSMVKKTGLFNPHTVSGSIVVDGVICSTFTLAVQECMANALLAPIRALFRTGGITHTNAGWILQSGIESFPL